MFSLHNTAKWLFSAVVAGLLRMIIMLQIRVEDTVHPTTRILGTDLMTVDEVGESQNTPARYTYLMPVS